MSAQPGSHQRRRRYIDPADPATLDPADSRYMRADLPAVPANTTESSLRPRLQLSRTTSTRCGAGPASERLRGD
jgi:hypothetical protein